MADQNITALPVATSPTSSDQLLLVGATEEKLIDYDKLADAILTKLTSKQYTLDQGTKTLPAALNELNSNFAYSCIFFRINTGHCKFKCIWILSRIKRRDRKHIYYTFNKKFKIR